MKAQKVDVVMRRPGFLNVLSYAAGWVVAIGLILIGAAYALIKITNFAWPTLQWAIPLGTYLALTAWFLYRAMLIPDEVARSHRQYQAVILCVRNLIILIILFADMRTVVGL